MGSDSQVMASVGDSVLAWADSSGEQGKMLFSRKLIGYPKSALKCPLHCRPTKEKRPSETFMELVEGGDSRISGNRRL